MIQFPYYTVIMTFMLIKDCGEQLKLTSLLQILLLFYTSKLA